MSLYYNIYVIYNVQIELYNVSQKQLIVQIIGS
jgi:hypothetical protein